MLVTIVVVQPNGLIPEAADTAPAEFFSSYALMRDDALAAGSAR